jgi:hypothetical protein
MSTKIDQKWAASIRENVNALILEVQRLEGQCDRQERALKVMRAALEYYSPTENWLNKHGAYTDENSVSGTAARKAIAEADRILEDEE